MSHRREEIANLLQQRIVGGLHLGLLRPGSRLPSVRVLARELGTDPRVALGAYRQLEGDGLVELRERSGVFVADSAISAGETLPQTAEWVVGVLVQAVGRGVPPVEFPERVHGCLETVVLRAACIECNADQIAGLCRELERDYGLETRPVDLERLQSGELPTAVLEADLLVTTSFHAAEVQRYGERLGKPWVAISHRPEFLAEATRLLEEGELYFVATDPRFAGKLRTMFASTRGVENLRVLIVGRDDLSSIPSEAPAYVMPSARDRTENPALLARTISAPRVFSSDSSRALLSFIVGANVTAIRARSAAAPQITSA